MEPMRHDTCYVRNLESSGQEPGGNDVLLARPLGEWYLVTRHAWGFENVAGGRLKV